MPRKSKRQTFTARGCITMLGLLAVAVGAISSQSRPRQSLDTNPTRTPRSTQIAESRAVATRTPTRTPLRASPTPSRTFIPTPIISSKTSFAPSNATSVIQNRTIVPTRTPSPFPTVAPQPQLTTYTVTSNANLRGCPRTDCDVVGTVSLGQQLNVIGSEQGESFRASTVWYIVQRTSGTAYLHSSLARAGTAVPAPPPARTQAPPAAVAPPANVPNTSVPPADQQLVSTPTAQPAAPQWSCSGDIYNCSDFNNRNDLMSYFNACPGDPSRLDQNNDGVPCESLR
jgi:hypothetical protein